jgi:mannan endo-1,4-beta-mannosidase
MRRAGAAAAVAVLVAVLAGCHQPGFPAHAAYVPAPSVPASAPVPAGASLPAVASGAPAYIGVYERGVPRAWSPIRRFAEATGVTPDIALYYSAWHEKFWMSFANTAYAHGAVPFVQLQPDHVSLSAIAAGFSDSYLRSYARTVRAFGHPVILSFGHEMNGTWYPWSAGSTSPAVFRAAWRHVVAVFRAAGASNVTWLWTISSTNAAGSGLRQWWPGSAWVNWVGIDGYYYRASSSFTSVFGTTVSDVRTFTHDPILISETGVSPAAGPAKITSLFTGVRRDHLLGFVWFDVAQHEGIYHQDWRLENNPAALATFRRDAAAFAEHAPADARS